MFSHIPWAPQFQKEFYNIRLFPSLLIAPQEFSNNCAAHQARIQCNIHAYISIILPVSIITIELQPTSFFLAFSIIINVGCKSLKLQNSLKIVDKLAVLKG